MTPEQTEKLEREIKFWRVRTTAFPVDEEGDMTSINPVEVHGAVKTVSLLESFKAGIEALEEVNGTRDRIFDAVLRGEETVASNTLFQLEINANNALTKMLKSLEEL